MEILPLTAKVHVLSFVLRQLWYCWFFQ